MSLANALMETLCRDYIVWHVRHRLRKSFKSFRSEKDARDYFESLKHCKTRRIEELRPPKELMLEAFNSPNQILKTIKRK